MVISGAGPTLLALVEPGPAPATWQQQSIAAVVKTLQVDQQGVSVKKN